MVNFSDVVTLSRDAQRQQLQREQGDLAFMQGVMQAVQLQVQEGGGELSLQGDWGRLSENAVATFRVKFPPGCNVEEVNVLVGGHVTPNEKFFMIGPAGRSADVLEVKDHAGAVGQVMAYLLDVVREVQRLRERQ